MGVVIGRRRGLDPRAPRPFGVSTTGSKGSAEVVLDARYHGESARIHALLRTVHLKIYRLSLLLHRVYHLMNRL